MAKEDYEDAPREYNDIDLGRAAMLMDIQQKVANVAPQMQGILAEAGRQLKEINDLAEENTRMLAEEQQAELAEAQGLTGNTDLANIEDEPQPEDEPEPKGDKEWPTKQSPQNAAASSPATRRM